MKALSFEAFGVWSPFDPSFRYVTSPFFSPVTLATVRSILAVYTLVTLITTLAYGNANAYFSYFTDLSWTGITAYFLVSSVHTIAFVRSGQKSYPLQTWPRVLQLLHVILHSTVIVIPIIITIVFWIFISSPTTFETSYGAWSNLSQHAFNSVFALVEMLLTNVEPSPWTHMIPIHVILAAYLGVAYITFATQGFYTYTFLDPNVEHAMLAAFIVGIGIGSCVVFGAIKGICHLRQRVGLSYATREKQSDVEAVGTWRDMKASNVSLGKEI